MTMNVVLPRQPEQVAVLVDRMAGFFPQCKQVVRAWERLEGVRGFLPQHLQMPEVSRPELPDDMTDRGEFYKWQQDNRAVFKQEYGFWSQLLQAEDVLSFEVRLWRGRLDDVHSLLCTVKPWMDDSNLPAYKRWTGRVSAVLQRMSGLIGRFEAFDAPTEFDKACFIECFGVLWKRFRELKRVVGDALVEGTASSAPQMQDRPSNSTATPQPTEHFSQDSAPPAPQTGPTQKMLLDETREHGSPALSATFFLELVRKSDIRKSRHGERGRKFSPAEVLALIETAKRLNKRPAELLARRWARFTIAPTAASDNPTPREIAA